MMDMTSKQMSSVERLKLKQKSAKIKYFGTGKIAVSEQPLTAMQIWQQ